LDETTYKYPKPQAMAPRFLLTS